MTDTDPNPPLITWRESFCTGIAGVDHEHRALIEQINEVYSLIDRKADRESVIDSLGDIYGSISAHFALEEQMMEKRDYDQYQEHRADHERLLDEIRDITEAFEHTRTLDDEGFKRQLNDWFQLHFKTHDSRLHRIAELPGHDQVDESLMAGFFRSAKNSLLRRTGRD